MSTWRLILKPRDQQWEVFAAFTAAHVGYSATAKPCSHLVLPTTDTIERDTDPKTVARNFPID